MKPITILLVDDNQEVRRAFRAILEFETDFIVVGEAKNGREAVDLAEKLSPDLILMDMIMPVLNGMDATRQILQARPAAKVLMLSAHSDEVYSAEATSAGAMGFLVKQTCTRHVAAAIREVHQGGRYFSRPILELTAIY